MNREAAATGRGNDYSSTGPPDTVAMEDTYNNIVETMWMAQHQAASHVPQPGLALQGEDGQEAKLHLQEYRGPAGENDTT